MPDFIDIHSHLNFDNYAADYDAVVARLKATNTWTITVGTDYESSLRACEISEKLPESFASVGLHPNDTGSAETTSNDATSSNTASNPESHQTFDEEKFATLLSRPKVVAVGECGLDYSRIEGADTSIKNQQKEIFEKHIDLALRHDKPLMIHCRDAYDDLLEIISYHRRSAGDKLRGNVHFFAGTVEIAEKFLDLGFTLSFTGVVTFARNYDEVIRFAPLEMIMSETDAPFVSPVPYRGKRNEPSYVIEIVKAIADIRNEPLEKVKKAFVSNAFRVFGLKK